MIENSKVTTLTPESPVFKNSFLQNNGYYFTHVVQAPPNYTLDLFYSIQISETELYDGDFLIGILSPSPQSVRGYFNYLRHNTSTRGGLTLC